MAKKQNKIKKVVLISEGKIWLKWILRGRFLNLKLSFLLGLISFVLYANTLKNGYVYDDKDVITGNSIVTRGIASIPQIFSTPYRHGTENLPNDLYRPLALITFAVELQFFGLNPLPGHFVNIVLFAGCVILLFVFLRNLFEQKKTFVPFVASLLFALHPIHTEVVANIKSRDELLCFFFAFLSLNVFTKYVRSGNVIQLTTGCLCLFLSLLSKESAITFVAVIPLTFFFYLNEHKKYSAYIFICTALAALVFLILRFSVLKAFHADHLAAVPFIDNALAKKDLTFESRTATAILILGYYFRLLFIPFPLISDYSYNSIPFVHFSDWRVLISLAVYIFLCVLSISRFLKNHKDAYAFAILFFLLTISLVTNIPFLIGTTMGERLLFLPSVGFCLSLALFMETLAGPAAKRSGAILKSQKILGSIALLSLIYIFITFHRNCDWSDNYSLYKADVKKAPYNCKLNYNLATEIEKNISNEPADITKQQESRQKAISFLVRSIVVYPDFINAQRELGVAYFQNSQYDSAELHDKKAIELDPGNADVIGNLAALYFVEKEYAKAIEMGKKVLQLNPSIAVTYSDIAGCYGYLGKYDSAVYYLHKGIIIDPDNNQLYEYLAVVYKAMGKTDSAIKYESIAQKNTSGFR